MLRSALVAGVRTGCLVTFASVEQGLAFLASTQSMVAALFFAVIISSKSKLVMIYIRPFFVNFSNNGS